MAAMEKPPFRQNVNCGDWEMKERLGMGGFAHVYLYQHCVSVPDLNPPPLILTSCKYTKLGYSCTFRGQYSGSNQMLTKVFLDRPDTRKYLRPSAPT